MSVTGGRSIEVIGHGGAGAYFPGNSRQSIERALEIGVDRIEFDVQECAGDLVLVHDDQLRLPNGGWRMVRAMTVAELRDLLPGLLTFGEAVELIDRKAPILIDVKSTGYEASVSVKIERHRLERADTMVSSTHVGSLRLLRSQFPLLRLGISTGHMANSVPFKPARTLISGALQRMIPSLLGITVRAIKATDVMIQYRACSPRLVELMHSRNVRVNVWTVDSKRQIERVAAMGVDSITSNRPDLVLETVRRKIG